jgi:hypothetical protein
MAGNAEVRELLENSDFDSAFDLFTGAPEAPAGADDTSDAEKAEADKAAADAAAAEAEKAEADKAAADAAAEADRVAAEKAAADAAVSAAPQPLTAADIAAAVATALKPAEPAAPAAAEPEDAPEVVAALAELEKDWGTHAIAINALLAKQEKKVRTDLKAEFEEILKPLKEQLAPVIASTQATAADQFRTALTAAHPDAYELEKDMEVWIAGQPEYLQPAYNKVLDEGSAAAVAKLFTDFKAATGRTSTAADDKAAKEALAQAEAAERLKKMETPSGTRTSVTAEADPNDFDSAFEAGIKKALAA